MTTQTQFLANQIHPSVFIGQGAVIVGDVTLEELCSVWFNATLRGDTTPLHIGSRTNIQEGSILHADPGFPTIIGSGVTVGHGAVVHGAQIGNNSLVGIRTVLLNGVKVGENCIIGANSLLTQGKVFPAGSLILGSPAKVVRELSAEEIESNRVAAAHYVERAHAFKATATHQHPK
jgi:carbonic anhydrase/acetyltransferase-like protein (isoleucine patch superfamily)